MAHGGEKLQNHARLSLKRSRANQNKSAKIARWFQVCVGISLALLAAACGPRHDFRVELVVRDEQGRNIPGATIEYGGADPKFRIQESTNRRGCATLRNLDGPQIAVIRAEGFLAEPVPIGWEYAGERLEVRMTSDLGGRRIAMHFGGDAMFGRRYELPKSGEPLIPEQDPATGALQVVRHLQHAFAAADFRTLNLETVIGNLGIDTAYPGKRFLLIARPETLAAVRALETDVVTLANNHSRDWLDLGVETTITALEQYRVPYVGAGMTAEAAEAPIVVDVKGSKVGVFSYTSVTGSFVNDHYPDADDPVPHDLAEKDQWLYEARSWGFSHDEFQAEYAARRHGEVWRMFESAERELSDEAVAALWASMVEVYPELQDWVARRGHGGAARWRTSKAVEQIQALRPEVDVLIVQLHAGFQFQPAASANIKAYARSAIDAGADIIIAHHPHVLQGIEWYKGKLIVYSLGNFIFDQDFLSTFSSGFVRTIWEDGQLYEARFVPLVISGYQPTPVTGSAAQRIVNDVWARSQLPASTARDSQRDVRVILEELDLHTRPAGFELQHNTGKIVAPPASRTREIELAAGEVLELSAHELSISDLGRTCGDSSDLYVGRDLFGWGDFEDVTADDDPVAGVHWSIDADSKSVEVGDAADGRGYLSIRKWHGSDADLLVRPVARIPLIRHRLWREVDEEIVPADPTPEYSFLFTARLDYPTQTALVIDIYHFDDTNPTEDPGSDSLARVRLPFEVDPRRWREFEVPMDIVGHDTDELQANMIMPYIAVSAPDVGNVNLDIDRLKFIEWRRACAMPKIFSDYTHIANRGETDIELEFDVLSSEVALEDSKPSSADGATPGTASSPSH